jgi:uncharacterized zinc-type alcohol dehydrogenase-like protein
MQTLGYAAHDAQSPLAPFRFERRALRDNDVAIEVLYCGICHTDLHLARDAWKDWGPAKLSRRFRAMRSSVGSSPSRRG